MSPFKSLRDYETFVYTLSERFLSIIRSTLIVARRGSHLAELTGDLAFPGGHRLVMYERLSWDTGPLTIEGYSYEVWRGNDKVYWYDSQPHPADSKLAGTHPHHKHVPPNIKHHRIPAPELSFIRPNIPFLIHEIETTLLQD